jgi:hypothetical protein
METTYKIKLEEALALPVHPTAEAFPMMNDQELAHLAQDIKDHYLYEPIILEKHLFTKTLTLLDGRNRLRAIKMLGEQEEVEYHLWQEYRWPGHMADQPEYEEALRNYILSRNLVRRDLTPDQRAMIVATPELVAYYKEKGRGAKVNGSQKGSLIVQQNLEQNGTKKSLRLNLTQGKKDRSFKTSEILAAQAKVGETRMKQAMKLVDSKNQLLITEVRAGRLSLRDALKQLKGTPEKPAKPAKPFWETKKDATTYYEAVFSKPIKKVSKEDKVQLIKWYIGLLQEDLKHCD